MPSISRSAIAATPWSLRERTGSTMSVRAGCLFVALILVADIVTKAIVESSISIGQSIVVIPGFFSLVSVRNPGGAFGVLASLGEPWGKVFFVSAATFTVVLLGWFIRELPESERVHRAALFAVIAGAIGNVIDRLVYGEVVDFLDFYVGTSHWPAFNVADIAITVGVTLLVIMSFLGARGSRHVDPAS